MSSPPTARLPGYDIARALAVWGMVAEHFALVMAAAPWHPAWLAAAAGFLDGRPAATFVILAGCGLSLQTRAGDPAAVRRRVARRGLFLLAAGFLNLVVWPGDILRVYGVGLLLASRCLGAPARRLWLIAAVFALGFVLLCGVLDYEAHWEWQTLTYRDLWTPEGVVRNLFFDGFRSVVPWVGLLFVGMWLGRRVTDDRTARWRIGLTAAAVAVATEFLSAGLVRAFLDRPDRPDAQEIEALFGTGSMPPLPLFLVAATGTAVAIICLCLELGDRFAASWWVRALAATGQMAFTWYVAHILLGLGAVLTLGLAGQASLATALATGTGFFAGAVLISAWWRGRGRTGPLEWLLRRVAG
jgi:uncharacterized membrane protein YeiB